MPTIPNPALHFLSIWSGLIPTSLSSGYPGIQGGSISPEKNVVTIITKETSMLMVIVPSLNPYVSFLSVLSNLFEKFIHRHFSFSVCVLVIFSQPSQ